MFHNMLCSTPVEIPSPFPGIIGYNNVPPPCGTKLLKPVASLQNWQLATELLPLRDPESEFYNLEDVAPCVGSVALDSLRRHAKTLADARGTLPPQLLQCGDIDPALYARG